MYFISIKKRCRLYKCIANFDVIKILTKRKPRRRHTPLEVEFFFKLMKPTVQGFIVTAKKFFS